MSCFRFPGTCAQSRFLGIRSKCVRIAFGVILLTTNRKTWPKHNIRGRGEEERLSDAPPPAQWWSMQNPQYAFLPQDEPQKQIQDPAKSPQAKEEGSMNILNSHSPKHENNRPTSVIHDQGGAPNNAEEYTEVNMLQNNLV